MVLVGIFFGGTAGAELPPQDVQGDSPYCSDNYVSHCIPTNIGDVDCDRFGGWGVQDVIVIGVDEFALDANGDGIGCTVADLNFLRALIGLPPVVASSSPAAAAAAPVPAPPAAAAAAAPTALAVTGAEDMPIAIVGVTLVLAGFMIAGFVRRETASA